MTLNPAEAGGRLPFHMSQRGGVCVGGRQQSGQVWRAPDHQPARRAAERANRSAAAARGGLATPISPQYATALKVGTTALVAQLLAAGWNPDLYLDEAVRAIKSISRNPGGPWPVELVDGRTISAIDVQWIYLEAASSAFAGRDADTDWTLAAWSECLDGLATDPESLIGKVDWVTKLSELRDFADDSPEGWADPDLVKLDLAYHPRGPDGESVQRVAASRSDVPAGIGTGESAGNSEGNARRGPRADRAGAVRGAGPIRTSTGRTSSTTWARWRAGRTSCNLVYQYIEHWRELDEFGGWSFVPYLVDWDGIGVRGEHL